MPRIRPSLPIRTKKDGYDAAAYYDPATGKRHFKFLGRPGDPDNDTKFAKLVSDAAAARVISTPVTGILIDDMCDRFLSHAEVYYRGPDGRVTSELGSYEAAISVLLSIETDTAAKDFGPLALQRVRDAMVARGWTRQTINSQVGRIRRIWGWAVSQEMVPPESWMALKSVRGLSKGRTKAPDQTKVQPVADKIVDATLPELPHTVAGMVRFHRLVGCRPQDVCKLRSDQIDQSGEVWVFRPGEHKGAWRGQDRLVWIGPRAQEVLRPFLEEAKSAGSVHVFSPRREVERQRAERAAERETPLWPSHVRRRESAKPAKNPKRPPADRYTTSSYARAVLRACKAAEVDPWSPNQLRHAAGTRFRKEFGIETTRVLLGHKSAVTSEIYAERDGEAAERAAREVG